MFRILHFSIEGHLIVGDFSYQQQCSADGCMAYKNQDMLTLTEEDMEP